MSTIASSRPAGRRIHPLVRFVLRRLAIGVVLLAFVSVLVFAATQVLPSLAENTKASKAFLIDCSTYISVRRTWM